MLHHLRGQTLSGVLFSKLPSRFPPPAPRSALLPLASPPGFGREPAPSVTLRPVGLDAGLAGSIFVVTARD